MTNSRFNPTHLTELALYVQASGLKVMLPVHTDRFDFKNISTGIVYSIQFVGSYVTIREKESNTILWDAGNYENNRNAIESEIQELAIVKTNFVIDTIKYKLEGRYDVSTMLSKDPSDYGIIITGKHKQFSLIYNSTNQIVNILASTIGSAFEQHIGSFEVPDVDKKEFVNSIVTAIHICELYYIIKEFEQSPEETIGQEPTKEEEVPAEQPLESGV